MSIFVTGDCHALTGPNTHNMMRLGSKKWAEGKELTKNDILIILGDVGIIFSNQPDREEKYLIKWLSQKKWTTLFIDGNHDNHPRLFDLPIVEKFGAKLGQITDSLFYIRRGEILDMQGKTFFCMGGADSYDKEWRKEGIDWWPTEIPSYAEMDYALDKLGKHQFTVNYILAHTAPDDVVRGCGVISLEKDTSDATRRFLAHIVQSIQFDKFFCGHWHRNVKCGKYNFLFEEIIQVI